MAVNIVIRPVGIVREGNTLRISGTQWDGTPTDLVLTFGGQHHIKTWLLEATYQVMGKHKAELVTGTVVVGPPTQPAAE